MKATQTSLSPFLFGFDGQTLTPRAKTFIQDYKPSGFLFFRENCDNTEQIKVLLRDIKDVYAALDLPPPLLAIDHEGGNVHRLPDPITHFSPAAELGATLSPSQVEAVGYRMAHELTQLGFNVNFAPVCDIRTPQTPTYLASRSFSTDPSSVSKFSLALFNGLRQGGLLACAKHFPGLGSAAHDPHFSPISSDQPLEVFEKRDWQPFKTLIQHNVPFIMTSHMMCPKLDPNAIGTFSAKLVRTYLKSKLGFHGRVLSDDLTMGAIQGTLVESAIQAIQAGHDLIILSNACFEENAMFLEEIKHIPHQ